MWVMRVGARGLGEVRRVFQQVKLWRVWGGGVRGRQGVQGAGHWVAHKGGGNAT